MLFDILFKNSKPKARPKKAAPCTEVLGGIEVKYRKNPLSKSIRITMKPDGTALVTLPANVSYARAKDFAAKNLEWIKSNAAKTAPQGAFAEDVIKERRKLAHKVLPQRLEALAKKFGFKYGRVSIKNHKTIWGSCSFRNNINLNLNLVALDDDCINYVLLHELTHTVHKNHQKAFYALLTKNMPNALEVQKKLKKIKISSL